MSEKIKSIDNKELLLQLEQLAEQLGYGISYADMPGKGGLVRLRGKGSFIINRSLATEEKIDVICENLRALDLGNIYLLPALRRRIYNEE